MGYGRIAYLFNDPGRILPASAFSAQSAVQPPLRSYRPEFWREKYITHSVIMIYINFQLLGTGTRPLENQGNLCFLHGYTLPPKNHPGAHQIQHHQGFSLLEMKFSWLNSGIENETTGKMRKKMPRSGSGSEASGRRRSHEIVNCFAAQTQSARSRQRLAHTCGSRMTDSLFSTLP